MIQTIHLDWAGSSVRYERRLRMLIAERGGSRGFKSRPVHQIYVFFKKKLKIGFQSFFFQLLKQQYGFFSSKTSETQELYYLGLESFSG